jgi:hypothetical protein
MLLHRSYLSDNFGAILQKLRLLLRRIVAIVANAPKQ